jgi:hypothetical protein
MSMISARLKEGDHAPVDRLVLALQRSRITRALRATRECRDRMDFIGALDAEKKLNKDLDLLGRLLRP